MLLKRKALSTVHSNPDTEVQKLRQALYEKAETLLGYPKKERTQRSYELHNALNKLGIKPFTDESVARYKAMLKSRPPLACYLRALLTAALVYGTYWAWKVDIETTSSVLGVVCTLSGIAGVVLSIWSGLMTVTRYFETTRTWASVRFDQLRYADVRAKVNVPDFALETALRVKEAVPAVNFNVEYLSESRHQIRLIDPDPFLVATLGHEQYYLEVWDERDYKEERES